jgi:short-subunit dehydrogenase
VEVSQLSNPFHDKRVLITGASRGIGKQLAQDFAREGACCLLVARDAATLEENRRQLPEPDRHASYPCDVSSREKVDAMALQVLEEQGPVDILVNNAGVSRYTRFLDTSIEENETLMQINYWGMLYCTRAFLPAMVERSSGHIVNLSSISGKLGTVRHTAYSASKFAVAGFSESLYFELLGTGVKIMVVNPGVVETHLFDHASFADFPDEVRKMMKPPHLLTRRILKGIRKGKFEVTFPGSLWSGVVARAVCPPLFRILQARFLKIPRTNPRTDP